MLLRDTDINRVGTLLRGGTAAGIRPGWRVSARATQQLRSFNQPYQLGYAPGHADKFEEPWKGETLVLPVHEEDILIAGSDGCGCSVTAGACIVHLRLCLAHASLAPPQPL